MATKILVVDDEPDLQSLICQQFKEKIHNQTLEFFFVATPEAASRQLQEQCNIAIVICDLDASREGCFALLSQLGEEYPQIKTIITSTCTDLGNVRGAMNLGAFDFLSKPLDLEDVEVTLDKAVEHLRNFQGTIFKERQAQANLLVDLQMEISKREQVERVLLNSERKLAQFLEAIPVGVFVLDNRGKPYYINQIAETILGKGLVDTNDAQELTEIYQVYLAGTQELYPISRNPVIRALQGEGSAVDDLEVKQGERRIPVEIWATPIFDQYGEVIYAIAAFQDITQRKQAEAERVEFTKELEEKNLALERMDRVKDEFLANTSHELRTPINGIIGITESLIDGIAGEVSEELQTNLAMVAASGRRLSRLIDDILDFAKLRNKEINLHREAVDFWQVTEIVLALSNPLIADKPLQLVNEVSPEIPPVYADENRLQQIMYNLIGNAIKFTQTGTITVSATLQGEMLEVNVADTGIGIPEEEWEKIFQSFSQVDASASRKYGGTGLGLSITKQLIELQEGEIRVESKLNQGSCFIFTLPISGEDIKEPRNSLPSRQQLEMIPPVAKLGEFLGTETNNAGEFTILVVDDEAINRQVIFNHLSQENYLFLQASSGAEALEIINQGNVPDLVLLDIMMPQMSGYQVCQRIREHFSAVEVPVVMLTAKNQVDDLVIGLTCGANDYLAKPVAKSELLARIKTHLELAKINAAYERFVPQEFLRFLGHESIIDLQLGEQVQREMSIMFADIRSFTTLSEAMSPKENFDFINAYLSRVSPVIQEHRGFIDKYIGDSIMALFPASPEDAVKAAIKVQQQVAEYNEHRRASKRQPITIGVGLHTGSMMLGTIGYEKRLETTVISDAVNLASRLEDLTKAYGASILTSGNTLLSLESLEEYNFRFLGRIKLKGKKDLVSVFEIFDTDPPEIRRLKNQTKTTFEYAIVFYYLKRFRDAQKIFEEVLDINPQDRAAMFYVSKCQESLLYKL